MVPDYQLSAMAGAIGWPIQPDVAAPLLFVCQGRHPAVVIAVIDCPALLVQCVLPLAGGPHVLIGLLRCQPVNGYEMPQQFCPSRVVAGKKDMLDVMAVLAQGLEAAEPLAAGLFVVLPDLVAVQPAFAAANPAAVSGSLVNGPANVVPVWSRQEVSQTG